MVHWWLILVALFVGVCIGGLGLALLAAAANADRDINELLRRESQKGLR